ncbi:MAG: hypothetical protein PVI23_03370 [Maricaulaceae bacterium]|jgi:hypothetical protein
MSLLRFLNALAIACVVAIIAACASTTSDGGNGAAAFAADGELRVGALPPRDLSDLEPGQCGLFLWGRTGERPLVFFFNSTTGRAAMVIDGSERALRRLEVTSSSSGARYGEQMFADIGGEVTARVAIDEREDVANGARITRAVLSVSDDRGWRSVIGVGGLAACAS